MRPRFDDPAAGHPSDGAQAVQHVRLGEHLCAFHPSGEEQRRLTGAVVAVAMAEGERVVYVTGEPTGDAVAELADDADCPAGELVSSGQLTLIALDTLCGPPPADLEQVLDTYRREAERSLSAGFAGTCVAVNMRGVAEALGSVERLVRWEGVVGRMFEGLGVRAVCQYHRPDLSAADRDLLTAEHVAVAIDDGTTPQATITRSATDGALQVAGELDLATGPRLARALRARTATSSRVEVDFDRVSFIDVGALRVIFEVARDLPQGSALVLRRLPDRMRRLLDLVRWRDPRVEIE
jgi:anti-anti-sigma factor